MDSARVNRIADFTGRAVLVAFFGCLATIQTLAVIGLLADPAGPRFVDLAVSLANLAFIVLIVGMTIARLKPIRNAKGFEPRFSALVGTFLSLSLVALPQADYGIELRITALILSTAGCVFSAYVLMWLGRAFSIMAQARHLVTTGPYAIVRHPLYLCEEVAVLGVVLTHFSLAAVLIIGVHWIFQLRRMTNEETVLRAVFPEYAAYARRTPKVIPCLFARFRLRQA